MRAVVFHAHGPRENLVVEKVPRPEPAPGEVLVEIKVAGTNHLDVHTRRGIPGIKLAFPHVPGSDGAGVVAALGAGVTGLSVGQRVVLNPMLFDGTCEFCLAGEQSQCVRFRMLGEHTSGTYGEYRNVPARNVVPLPDHVPFEVAAAAPTIYLTAWRMARRARLKAGDDVLVFGASGGVGTASVDVARLLGCRVFAATTDPRKAEKLRAIGADVVLSGGNVAEQIRQLTAKRGVDAVLDQVGADTYPAAIRSLRKGGRYVTCGATTGNAPPAELHYVFWNQLEVVGSTMANLAETREVLGLLFAGKLQPAIDTVLPLEEAREAHRRLEEREHFGKILLRV